MSVGRYRRIVVELREGPFNAELVGLAADLSGLMRIHLVGRFIQDEDVARLAGLPFAREFRPLEQEWHLLTDMAGVMEIAAASTRRLFAKAANASSAEYLFEIVQGNAQRRDMDDIVVVSQRGGKELTRARIETALEGVAGVLFVPGRITRQHGPIFACIIGQHDPALDVATRIAESAGERLIRVHLHDGQISRDARLAVFGSIPGDMNLPLTALRRGVPVLVLREAAEPLQEGGLAAGSS